MRVLISAVGTRGDVQPAIALALEARALGHAVRLCVPPNFVAWAAGLGFEARPIGIEMRAPRAGAPPVAIPDLILDQFESVAAAADGCDFIVGAGAHQYAARSIAELRGIPCVVAVYAPTALPPDVDESRGAWNQRSLERVNANRARLGLAAIDDVIAHILGDAPWLAADATLGPAPAGARARQTGAWLLSDDTPLAVELQRFLDAGDPPIYAGFGSMPGPPGTSRTVIDAARAAGRRVILSAGWAELGLIDDGPDCIVIDDVNHGALFPRVAAVVHHGGAGTTTTAARAGAPQVVVPMFSDQPYWGRRVSALGIGASTALTPAGLAAALREALDPAVAARARALAPKVSADGARIAAYTLGDAARPVRRAPPRQ